MTLLVDCPARVLKIIGAVLKQRLEVRLDGHLRNHFFCTCTAEEYGWMRAIAILLGTGNWHVDGNLCNKCVASTS